MLSIKPWTAVKTWPSPMKAPAITRP